MLLIFHLFWHFYVVDLCLQCHLKGIGVKVFDSDLIHLSNGTIDENFKYYEEKVARKYSGIYPIINYCCGSVYTNLIIFYIQNIYRRIKYRNNK